MVVGNGTEHPTLGMASFFNVDTPDSKTRWVAKLDAFVRKFDEQTSAYVHYSQSQTGSSPDSLLILPSGRAELLKVATQHKIMVDGHGCFTAYLSEPGEPRVKVSCIGWPPSAVANCLAVILPQWDDAPDSPFAGLLPPDALLKLLVETATDMFAAAPFGIDPTPTGSISRTYATLLGDVLPPSSTVAIGAAFALAHLELLPTARLLSLPD